MVEEVICYTAANNENTVKLMKLTFQGSSPTDCSKVLGVGGGGGDVGAGREIQSSPAMCPQGHKILSICKCKVLDFMVFEGFVRIFNYLCFFIHSK